ncbi:MAG: penicillin acylase family protein [Pseudomonadaceae bacterium]|nr:penicillin acylase family protein [Pseudomonadaceae bacterium]
MRFPTATTTILALVATIQLAQAAPSSTQNAALDTAEALATLSYSVDGLNLPAEILIDRWGVPHIYANEHYDAFLVQGFNAARDRLWQIDTWRRRGLGELSEVFGKRFAEQDRAARLFLYRGDMYREWLAYGSDAKKIAEAFVAGINAYIDLIEGQPELMPVEFTSLGYAPSKWQAEDVVRIRSNGLWRNVVSEVRRARLLCEHGPAVAADWKVLEPTWAAVVPEGFDPCSLPKDVLNNYLLAKAPVSFEPGDSAVAAMLARVEQQELNASLGSNNWVVAPDRTDTGRPILADDPHRGHAAPSLRYISHLVAPGLNVIGAGEPALPGISIGHNERIAFGLTIFPIDQEDLYVYTKSRGGYRYQGRTEPFRIVREFIDVRDADAREIALKFTRHGPVIYETKSKAYAVRAAWLDEGMSPYFGSIEYMRAQNWREFVAALNRWGAPSENQVYADVDGNIGYKPAGLFPRRDNWDGLLPVPGDGRYEWNGYFDMDVLPQEYNPERGFTGTANAMNLPADYPIDRYRVGFEWSAPYRYQRLWEVLESQPNHSLADSSALQRDYHSILARRAVTLIGDDNNSPAATMLREWDSVLSADSAAAALYAIWYYRHLEPAMAAILVGNSRQASDVMPLDSYTVLKLAGSEDGQPIVAETLNAAWAETELLLGVNPSAWQWGELHEIHFAHPLVDLVGQDMKELLAMPVKPRGGSGNTTNNTSFSAKDFRVRSGASFRMVLDVGNWDAAEMTNAPGQSGDPRSPHYRDLLDGWANDEAFPLLYSRSSVEQEAVLRIALNPKTGAMTQPSETGPEAAAEVGTQ